MNGFERVGTMAAIGTTPGKIMALFLTEGLTLGLLQPAYKASKMEPVDALGHV